MRNYQQEHQYLSCLLLFMLRFYLACLKIVGNYQTNSEFKEGEEGSGTERLELICMYQVFKCTFLYVFFIVKLTQHEIHHFNNFQVYDPEVFSTCTKLCNLTTLQFQFSSPQKKALYLFRQSLPHPSFQILGTTNLLQICLFGTFHVIHGLFVTGFFYSEQCFEVHLCCSMCQYFITFCG